MSENVLQPADAVSPAFIKQMQGYGMVTADILYRLPDHPALLQNFIWQEYDTAPEFPVLKRFLEFWAREIDGLLHSVTIAHCGLIKPAEFKAVDGVLQLH